MTAFPYDVKLSIGATEYGFMLVTPPGQSKQLAWSEVGPPDAQRVSTADAATHTDFPPDKDVPFAMSSFAGGAGELEFSIDDENTYWWGVAVTHVDGKVYLPPAATAKSLSSADSQVNGFTTYYVPSTGVRYDFCWSAHRLYRRAADSSTAWTLVWSQADSKAITDFKIINGAGFICCPTLTDAIGGDFYYQSDVTAAATWTPTLKNHTAFSDSAGRPKFMAHNRATVYAAVDNRKLFFSTDPTADSWTGPIDTSVSGNFAGQPGDNTYPWQAITPVGDYLLALKQDAGYNVDSQQDVAEIFWQWVDRPSPKNFEFVSKGGDMLWFSTLTEVFGYDPSTGRTTPLGISVRTGVSVRTIYGMAADNRYVYVLAQVRVPRLRASDSMALMRFYQTGARSWGFEVLWEDTDLTNDEYHGLAVFPDGAASRVYWGQRNTNTNATQTYHMDIPADWDESTASSFATAGTLYTSISKSGFPGLKKLHIWISLLAQNLSATETINVAYSTNEGSSFTSLATLTADESTTSYADLTSRSIVLRFTFAGSGSATPVLRSFDHHQRPRFRYLPTGMLAVRVADHIELNNGSKSPDLKTDLVSHLETLRANEGANWIAYEDVFGRSFDVIVDKIDFKISRHEFPVDKYEQEAVVSITRVDKGS